MRLAWWMGALALSVGVYGCGPANEEIKTAEAPDVSLPNPGPDGFQLQTDLIPVDPGQEVQNCYFFEVPFDRPVLVNRITLGQNAGSHHMNVFRVRTIQALDGAPGDVVYGGECWKSTNWADWPLVANSQSTGIEDWSMPDGVALRLEAHEKLMLQSHYVNATTQTTPTHGKAMVDFYGLPDGSTAEELGTLFATNQSIKVCPGQTDVSYSATCPIAADHDVTVIAATGHFHSRGDRFTMRTFDAITQDGAQFYESTSWDHPPFTRGLDVKISMGNLMQWTCEFSAGPDECGDPANGCCFTFGGHVEYQEHCNAFVYYYPRGSTERNCF